MPFMPLSLAAKPSFGPILAIERLRLRFRAEDAHQLQLHHQGVDKHRHRGTAGFNDEVRDRLVERIPLLVHLAKAREWITHLQQGALRVMSKAAIEFLGRRSQIDDVAVSAQFMAIRLSERCPASRGQDNALRNAQLRYDLRLDVSEGRFTLLLEEAANGAGDALLDDCVGINEWAKQTLAQMATYGGFATTRKSN